MTDKKLQEFFDEIIHSGFMEELSKAFLYPNVEAWIKKLSRPKTKK